MLAVCDCFALRFVDRMPFRLVRRIDCGIDSLLHSRFCSASCDIPLDGAKHSANITVK